MNAGILWAGILTAVFLEIFLPVFFARSKSIQLQDSVYNGMTSANFSKANMMFADFSQGNFSGANFAQANLKGVNFEGAYLSGANLKGAEVILDDLKKALLTDAIMPDGSIHK